MDKTYNYGLLHKKLHVRLKQGLKHEMTEG